MSTCTRIAIIMAGGSGERFWPLSRQTHPKQLLHLNDPDQSLLSEAVDRLTPLLPADAIYVATSRPLQATIQHAGLPIPSDNVIAEPAKRNTSGCLAYAVATALNRHGGKPEAISMAVVTADHRIRNHAGFRTTVTSALHAAEQHNAIVTIGVPPARPETGYGYIEISPAPDPVAGSTSESPVYAVQQFHEKPTAETALAYLNAGHFLWNSGMFFWRLDTFLSELQQATPELARATLAMAEAMRQNDTASLEAIFTKLDDLSIDYALLEKATQVLVAPAQFDWDDVGAWDALDRAFVPDQQGNISVGDPVLIDSRNCIVYNAGGASSKAVALIGADNLVVVVADDAVLIVPKDRAQDVKAAVQELKRRNAQQL